MFPNIHNLLTPQGQKAALGARPLINTSNPQDQLVKVRTPRGLLVNSALLKDEWEELDSVAVREATARLRAISDLVMRGLVKEHTSIGTILSQYNQSSEMTGAKITIDGAARGDRDRVDFKLNGVTLPVIHKEYDFNARELAASRLMGDTPSMENAAAAARVVAEAIENMLFNGSTAVTADGTPIYGFTTHPSRKTGSASGDWGTVGNAVTTISAMITALQASSNNHFGPYIVYASTTQYNEAANVFFTDGSGDNQLKRIMQMAGIEAVYPSDWLAAGSVVMAQATIDVVDVAYVPGFGVVVNDDGTRDVTGVTNLEWMSGDGMTSYFKSLAIMVPRVKSTYAGRCGIAHYTGA